MVVLGECDVRRAARHWVRDEVFPFFAEIGDVYGMSFMAQARLATDGPTVFTQIVTLVSELRVEQADPDTKGDLFEHGLRQIKQAGELDEFRTPRYIIRAVVEQVDPRIGETVYDPAAGTAGFLIPALSISVSRIRRRTGARQRNSRAKPSSVASGTASTGGQWRKLQTATFYRDDVDAKMSASPRWTSLCAAFPTRAFYGATY